MSFCKHDTNLGDGQQFAGLSTVDLVVLCGMDLNLKLSDKTVRFFREIVLKKTKIC